MRPSAVVVATTLALVAALSSCASANSDLEGQLQDTGLTLYLPELAGQLPAGVRDETEPGVTEGDPDSADTGGDAVEDAHPTSLVVATSEVTITYTRSGAPAYELRQLPAPTEPLCRAVDHVAGSDCSERDGVMRSTMEEQTQVAVVRGNTLLVLDGLVTETQPGLADAAVDALQLAPVVEPCALVAVVTD